MGLTDIIATVLQALGIIALSIGAAFIYPSAGVITFGIGLLAFGLALERGQGSED